MLGVSLVRFSTEQQLARLEKTMDERVAKLEEEVARLQGTRQQQPGPGQPGLIRLAQNIQTIHEDTKFEYYKVGVAVGVTLTEGHNIFYKSPNQ